MFDIAANDFSNNTNCIFSFQNKQKHIVLPVTIVKVAFY